MHAFSSESIPLRGLSLTHLAGKGLLVACHGPERKALGMAEYISRARPSVAYESVSTYLQNNEAKT